MRRSSACLDPRPIATAQPEDTIANEQQPDQSPEPGADGGRTDQPRRARLRHLFAPAQGAGDLPGRRRRRPRRQRDRRADAVPGSRESREGHQPVHQLARAASSPPGMAIYDTMQFIKPDVSTICIGQAASMGALLLAAGAKGKRYALPNSRVMIHQPLGRLPGPGHRHRHPGARDPDAAPAPERDPGQAHRPVARDDRARHRARQLQERRGRARVRPGRPGPGAPPGRLHPGRLTIPAKPLIPLTASCPARAPRSRRPDTCAILEPNTSSTRSDAGRRSMSEDRRAVPATATRSCTARSAGKASTKSAS